MLKVKNLTIQQRQQVLLTIPELAIAAGEVVTLMGPSGSGKSTLLRWILGEPLADFQMSGELWLGQQRIDQRPIHLRKIGLLQQQADLFPHLRVIDNLLFALPRKQPQRQQQAVEALQAVQLEHLANAWPEQLSGGEQARIALIRSLLAEPQALLLDEPFSALDTELRSRLRDWVFKLLQQRNIPALLVTHDRADAPGKIIDIKAFQHD